jgi:hypothetical protein
MYVSGPPKDNPVFLAKFRRRFRVPFKEFGHLLHLVKRDNRFDRWKSQDAVGVPPSPIELLLLGCLGYLGRGLTFDDIEEYTAISKEVHRTFFHLFIKFGEEVLYPRFISYPVNSVEYDPHAEEYYQAGLPGACF